MYAHDYLLYKELKIPEYLNNSGLNVLYGTDKIVTVNVY